MENHIASTASISGSAELGFNCVIEEGVRIGERVRIGNNVVIHEGTQIGDDVYVGDNAVLGRQPRAGTSVTRKAECYGPLHIECRVVIGTSAVIYAGTWIGKDSMVADLAAVREDTVIGERARIGRMVAVGNNVRIGHDCVVQTGTVLSSDTMLEDDVFIGPGVCTCNDMYMSRRDYAFQGPVIRKGASIGGQATLLPGIEIGPRAVVGAGAVVIGDVPGGVLVVGNPARIVKRYEDQGG